MRVGQVKVVKVRVGSGRWRRRRVVVGWQVTRRQRTVRASEVSLGVCARSRAKSKRLPQRARAPPASCGSCSKAHSQDGHVLVRQRDPLARLFRRRRWTRRPPRARCSDRTCCARLSRSRRCCHCHAVHAVRAQFAACRGRVGSRSSGSRWRGVERAVRGAGKAGGGDYGSKSVQTSCLANQAAPTARTSLLQGADLARGQRRRLVSCHTRSQLRRNCCRVLSFGTARV